MMTFGNLAAPAKLNLSLEILANRPDGYHGLRSIMVPIALYDNLHWEHASTFRFACTVANLANDANLVMRAAKLLGLDQLGIHLTLEKKIPVGAGLGGGSSDAACLIRAASQGVFGALGKRDWLGIAAELGSDVPFFLVDGPALIEGRGERVTALGAAPAWTAVVIYPGCMISTKAAFALFDAAGQRTTRPRSQSVSIALGEALQRRDFAAVNTLLANDFSGLIAGEWPAVSAARAAFARAGATGHLSGSGAALFSLCEDAKTAQTLATTLAADHSLPDGAQIFISDFHVSQNWRTERLTRELV